MWYSFLNPDEALAILITSQNTFNPDHTLFKSKKALALRGKCFLFYLIQT